MHVSGEWQRLDYATERDARNVVAGGAFRGFVDSTPATHCLLLSICAICEICGDSPRLPSCPSRLRGSIFLLAGRFPGRGFGTCGNASGGVGVALNEPRFRGP